MDIDDSILRELRLLQRQEGKTFGRLVSELLAAGLATRRTRAAYSVEFRWISHPMGTPRVDLREKDALRDALDLGDPDETA